MAETRGPEQAPRVAVIAWPSTELPALLEANDAVVCCAHAPGGRTAVDALVTEMLTATILSEPGIARTPNGKPYLVSPEARRALNFNVSHSGEVLLVALSRTVEVGVDVELVRVVPEWRTIADRMFDARTRSQLGADLARGDAEGDAFIRYWCRLEAAVKATGAGLFGAGPPASPQDDAPRNAPHGRAPTRIIDLPDLPLPASTARYHGALALCL
jgi:hypothetical protein